MKITTPLHFPKFVVLMSCSMIRDPVEWRYFKRVLGLATPTEDELIRSDKLLLRPGENVYLPFKLQVSISLSQWH
jgi:hypothetical protein